MRKVLSGVLLAALCACAPLLPAQAVPNLVTAPIDESQVFPLRGNVHPLAQARYDRGAAPGATPTGRLSLVLQRSAAQQRALTQYLDDLQNPATSAYHKWLTPAQYGAEFGISASDLARVTGWLQSRGFRIEKIPGARNVVEFSGTFDQVQSAFHTAMHTFSVNGETHLANTSDPQIPAALAPVVAGVGPLNDFRPKPTLVPGPRARFDTSTGRIVPELTLGGGNSSTSYLFVDPADVATIYDTPNRLLNPSYTSVATYDGTGVKLGIVGVSHLATADVGNYRMAFLGETSTTVNLPTIVLDGPDPGVVPGVAIEALLDNEVAGGVAPGAKIYFYTAADTDLSSGLFNAMFRAVDDNVVSILSISFGQCEAGLGGTGNQLLLELAEQAAAQGITETVSAGDNGSAGCDNFDTQATATQGFGVSGFASTPYNVAVGGTDFDVLSKSFATYVTATSSGTPPYYKTALKYIPEEPWNDSTTVNGAYKDNVAYKNSGGGGGNIIAGSGGASTIHAKPSFQTSLTPQDGVRDLPDVSFLAGNLFYRATWVFCADNTAYDVTASFADCQTVNGQFTSNTSFGGVGGTSAAAPAFAGMIALVAQAHGSAADNYRLGQVDNVLYQLAHSKYSAVFHDVTSGNNSVACTSGSPNCSTSNSFLTGYNAGTGYDLATGLGSVDVAAMVSNWTSVSPSTTTTSLKINGSAADYTGVHGVSLKFDVSVHPATATGVAGLVDNANEAVGGAQNNGQYPIPLTSGAGSTTYNGLPGGSYTVWARYGGDTTNSSSTSSPPIHVTISPEPSTISETVNAFSSETGQPVTSLSSIPYGSLIFIDGQIAGTAELNTTQGVATGSVTFTDGTATLGSAAVNSSNLAPFLSAGTIPGGMHSVVANYPGDPSFSKSSSFPMTFTVAPLATTMTVNSGDETLLPNQSAGIVFTGATSWTPGVPPTGTVTASIGSTVLGTTTSFSTSSGYNGPDHYVDFIGNMSVGSSQFSTGLNTVTVAYGGDSNYTPSSATVQIDSVAAGGGPVINLPEDLTVGPGGTAIYPLSLSSKGGYTGFLTWGCDPVPVTSPSSCMSYGSPVPLSGSIDTLLIAIANTSTAGTYSANLSTFDNANAAIQVSKAVKIIVNSTASPSLALVNDGTFNVAPGGAVAKTSYVSIIPNGGLGGQVNLSCTVTTTISNPQSAPTCTVPASVALNGTSPVVAAVQVDTTSATTPGDYGVSVTATSATTASVTATNSVPLMVTTAHSFALSSEGTVTVTAGATTSNSTGVMLTPLNGFSGPVSLECILEPTAYPLMGQTEPECSVPGSVNVTAGSAVTANVTITSQTANPLGFYVVYVLAADSTSGTFGLASAIDLLLIGKPSFTLDPQANITVTAGATSGNTTSISVTPASGFTGTVNLVCAVTSSYLNGVDPPGCSLSPTSVTVGGSSAPASTLTVTTTAPTTAAVVPGVRPSRLPGLVALAMVLLFGIRSRRRAWMRILGLLVLLLWIAAPGCGGGGGGGGGGGSTGTTPGSYTVVVTGTDAATGKVTAQTKVTLTVN